MIGNNWDIYLKKEFENNYFIKMMDKIKKEYKNKKIFPEYKNIFKALKETDYKDVKIMILGQDPYHGDFEAQGLSFSVPNNIKTPPSLRNIFLELHNDLNITRKNNDLIDWAKQGILLLNSILTVEKDKPLSHKSFGWEMFTDEIIKVLNNREEPVIFVLLGKYAQSKKNIITNNRHYIIETSHPSPFSAHRGFLGSKIFSKINKILFQENLEKINW